MYVGIKKNIDHGLNYNQLLKEQIRATHNSVSDISCGNTQFTTRVKHDQNC